MNRVIAMLEERAAYLERQGLEEGPRARNLARLQLYLPRQNVVRNLFGVDDASNRQSELKEMLDEMSCIQSYNWSFDFLAEEWFDREKLNQSGDVDQKEGGSNAGPTN